VLSWLCKKGEETLKRHAELATNLPAIKEQEQDFEKFYFISMVSKSSLYIFRYRLRKIDILTGRIVRARNAAFVEGVYFLHVALAAQCLTLK
jgi:hypothetical protein